MFKIHAGMPPPNIVTNCDPEKKEQRKVFRFQTKKVDFLLFFLYYMTMNGGSQSERKTHVFE